MQGRAIVLLFVLISASAIQGALVQHARHFAKIGATNLPPPDEYMQSGGNSRTRAGSSSLTPAQIRTAYGITSLATTQGNGITVAVVDAYGCSNMESDMAEFNKKHGLPACTIANGCLTKKKKKTQRLPLTTYLFHEFSLSSQFLLFPSPTILFNLHASF